MVLPLFSLKHEHRYRDLSCRVAQWRIPWVALSFLFIVHTAFADGKVEIEVNDTPEPNDDYICWSPVPARIRVLGGSADVQVTLSSILRQAGQLNGEVWFAPFSAGRPTSANLKPVDTLAITLPKSGDWQSFWVAGKTASTDGQDTAIVVSDSDGQELSRTELMVRIRKNAESLKPIEIERFLQALAILHDVDHQGQNSKYLKYVKVHADAFDVSIHGVPAFLPWHRTMILSVERELQAIDPRVALPYWKFDEDAVHLFSPSFLGEEMMNSMWVNFSIENPLGNWRMPSNAEITAWQMGTAPPGSSEVLVRDTEGWDKNGDVTALPKKGDFEKKVAPDEVYAIMQGHLTSHYHNDAHLHFGGWMSKIESPKDPIFFLLHANVDRAWAQWQKDNNLFGETDTNAYSPQGAYPGKGGPNDPHQGNYADDTEWPWSLIGGDPGTPNDQGDDWPAFVFPFPASPKNHGPSAKPTTREMIDYQDADGSGLPLNYSYDTIPFRD